VKATGEPAEKQAARRETTHRLKFSYNEQREYERIDDEIAGLEEKLADLKVEQQQKATDYVALQALQGEQQALEQTLDEKMDRWVYLNDLAERITRQEKEMEKR
jgi:ATP-binding cassette subfamily F protein uup